MASFASLPAELTTRVLHFLDPGSHINFALTCHLLNERSQAVLDRHADCHARYAATSDILPSTLPRLLLSGARDYIALWHVRALEFWGSRRSWEDWQAYELDYPVSEEDPDSVRKRVDDPWKDSFARPFGRFFFSQAELDSFAEIMKNELHLDEGLVASYRAKLEGGDDSVLKGIAIGLCPRLQALRFVKSGARALENDEEGDQHQENTVQ